MASEAAGQAKSKEDALRIEITALSEQLSRGQRGWQADAEARRQEAESALQEAKAEAEAAKAEAAAAKEVAR